MNLNSRLDRLEAKSNRPDAPLLMVTLATGDERLPFECEHGGEKWTQEPGEDLEAFKERIKAATRKLRAAHGNALLVIKHPSLGRERWLELYGTDADPRLAQERWDRVFAISNRGARS